MAKATRQQMLRTTNDIRDLILDDKLLAAVNEMRADRKLLKQARANPRAFWQSEGLRCRDR